MPARVVSVLVVLALAGGAAGCSTGAAAEPAAAPASAAAGPSTAPGADQVTALVNRLGVVSRTDPKTRVIRGTDGYLFTSGSFELPCAAAYPGALVRSSLDEWAAAAAGSGKDVVFVVAPDKASLVPDRLPSRERPALLHCTASVRSSLVADWGAEGRSPMMLLWSDVAAAQGADPSTVTPKGDTHWSAAGAAVMVRHLLARLGSATGVGALPGPGEIRTVGSWWRMGDLTRALGGTSPDRMPVVRVDRPGQTTHRTTTGAASGLRVTSYRTRSSAPLVPGRTLVVHDSYMGAAEPLLAPYFSRVTFMYWADFVAAAEKGTVPPFDRLVLETSERGFVLRWANTLSDPAVRGAIRSGLS